MRLYLKTTPATFVKPAGETSPGFTLTEVIDQFYTEGVVPDFIPADLGDLMAGLDAAIDPAPAFNPTPASDPAPASEAPPASEE